MIAQSVHAYFDKSVYVCGKLLTRITCPCFAYTAHIRIGLYTHSQTCPNTPPASTVCNDLVMSEHLQALRGL